MKNYSRAYNRHKQHTEFIKRVKKWFSIYHRYDSGYYDLEIEETLKGERATFLRTTSRPCNCEMCTYLKYKRTPKHKVMKEAFKE